MIFSFENQFSDSKLKTHQLLQQLTHLWGSKNGMYILKMEFFNDAGLVWYFFLRGCHLRHVKVTLRHSKHVGRLHLYPKCYVLSTWHSINNLLNEIYFCWIPLMCSFQFQICASGTHVRGAQLKKKFCKWHKLSKNRHCLKIKH